MTERLRESASARRFDGEARRSNSRWKRRVSGSVSLAPVLTAALYRLSSAGHSSLAGAPGSTAAASVARSARERRVSVWYARLVLQLSFLPLLLVLSVARQGVVLSAPHPGPLPRGERRFSPVAQVDGVPGPPGPLAGEKAGAAATVGSVDDPVPLRPGTYWVYRESYTENLRGLDATQDARTRFVVRGSPGALFIHQSGGFDPAPGPVERGAGWLQLGPWTGEDALPLPLEVGRSRPAGGGTLEGWTVEALESVSVPAGDFAAAFRCALRTRRNISILWIVPGVGIVRETQGVPRRRPEIERVLLEWASPGMVRPTPHPPESAQR